MGNDSVIPIPDGEMSLEDILKAGLMGNAPKPDVEEPSDEDTDEGVDEDEEPEDDEVGDEDDEEDEDKDKDDKSKSTKLQYKSQEEAEKAVKAAKKRMHDATKRVKELERQLLTVEKPDPKPVIDPLDAIAKETASKIAALDKEDKDYNAKVMRIFAEQTSQVSEIQRAKERDMQSKSQAYIDYVHSYLKEKGYGDYVMEFWKLAPSIPSHIAHLDDAIDWTIGELEKMIRKVRGVKKGKKKDKGDDDPNEFVLGKEGNRNVKGKDKKENEDPKSIGDALKELRKTQVI